MYSVTQRSPAMPKVTLIPGKRKGKQAVRYAMQLEQIRKFTQRNLHFFYFLLVTSGPKSKPAAVGVGCA